MRVFFLLGEEEIALPLRAVRTLAEEGPPR